MNLKTNYKKSIIITIFLVGLTALTISYIMSYKWFNHSLNFSIITALLFTFFSVTSATIFMILGRQSKTKSRYGYYFLSTLFIVFSIFCSIAGQLVGISNENNVNTELVSLDKKITSKENLLEKTEYKLLEDLSNAELYTLRISQDRQTKELEKLRSRREKLEVNKSDNNVFAFLMDFKKSPAEWLKLFFILIPAILVDITHPICFTAVLFNNLGVKEDKKITPSITDILKPIDTKPDWQVEKIETKKPESKKVVQPNPRITRKKRIDESQLSLFVAM